MPSGASFLRLIDQSQQKLENAVQKQSTRLHELRLHHTQLRSGIAKRLLEIAQVQGQALDRDEIQGYDQTTQQLDQQLAARAARASLIEQGQIQKSDALVAVRAKAHGLADQLDAAVARINEIDAAARQALDADAAFEMLNRDADAAVERAYAAKAKAEKATKERTIKSGGYLADPLFCYLQGIGFGTPSYRGSAVVRTIDGWVASLCNYRAASRDFQALQQLPDYLAGLAEGRERDRIAVTAAVSNQARAARLSLGIEAYEKQRDRLNADSEKVQQQIDAIEAEISEAGAELKKFVEWRDAAGVKLTERLAEVLESESFAELQSRVLKTATDQDDRALRDLMDLRGQLVEVERLLSEVEKSYEIVNQRLQGMRNIRQRFRHENYHTSNYSIRGAAAAERLESFAQGAVLEADLWHLIRNSAKYDPPSSYSSSSSSSSSSSWGGGSFGSGGGFGGGGFKTGGGF